MGVGELARRHDSMLLDVPCSSPAEQRSATGISVDSTSAGIVKDRVGCRRSFA